MTNRNSLKGKEIVSGDTIIMPIANRMFDTIKSMAIKGRYNKKPISKASRSWLTVKAGRMMARLSSDTELDNDSGQISRAASTKNDSSR